MRERCEDFGRIAERLHSLLDNELLDAAMDYDKKLNDPYEALRVYTQDEDGIHKLMYSLQEIKEDLFELYELARWGDKDGD